MESTLTLAERLVVSPAADRLRATLWRRFDLVLEHIS